MKILCDHQTGYLPWLPLFYRVSLCDIYISLDTVKYQKREFESRNQIKTPNGIKWLNIPTLKGKSQILKYIKINNSIEWKEDHLKAIKFSYGKTDYFDYFYDKLEEILNKDHEFLMNLNEELFLFLLNEIDIKVEFHKASDLIIEGTKNNYLINICKYFGADLYVFGLFGENYVDKELWQKNGIKYYNINYKHPVYPQRFNNFIPNLSIIDLLFNNGSKKVNDIIINENITKKELINQFNAKKEEESSI